MIKIEREKDITFVTSAVTDFADALGYCEYKIPLSIRGVRPKPSQSLILGTKAHHAEEKYEQEHVELEPVTAEAIEDEKVDVEFARENVYSTLSMPFEFSEENVLLTLSGRIDKIMRVDGTLLVQDDKFVGRPQTYEQKTQPYPSQLLQVLAYLNSVYSGKRGNNPEDWFDLPHAKKNGSCEFVIERPASHTRYFLNIRMHFHCITCIRRWKNLQLLLLTLQSPNITTASQSAMLVISRVFVSLRFSLSCRMHP